MKMKMKRRIAVGCLISVGLVTLFMNQPICAEEEGQSSSSTAPVKKSSAIEQTKQMDEARKMMEQLMGNMISQMIEGMAKSMAKPEVAENMAVFERNYYMALIKQGFTEEEALRIIASTGLPSVGGKH